MGTTSLSFILNVESKNPQQQIDGKLYEFSLRAAKATTGYQLAYTIRSNSLA